MLLVCMKFVNCSILFMIPSVLKLQYVYVVCSDVCSIVGRGVRGVVWRRGWWWLPWTRGLMSPHWLCVWCVNGWAGWWSGWGWSLVSAY